MSQKVRTFEDLSDVCLFVASEVARGTLSPELAQSIKQLFDVIFTSIAANSKNASSSQAVESLGTLLAAMREANSGPNILPSYTTFEDPIKQDARAVIEIAAKR